MFQLKRLRVIYCIWLILLSGQFVRSQNMDIDLLKSANPQYPRSVFWKATSNSYMVVAGTASLGTLAYALLEKDKDLQHKSYELLMAIGVNVLVTDGIKAIFNRRRPAEAYPEEIFILTSSKGHSFPSGHTSLAFATATSLTLSHKRWYVAVPAYLWAGCVGYSRMYLGRHYPSDVLAGAIVGSGSSVLCHWISGKIFEVKTDKSKRSNAF